MSESVLPLVVTKLREYESMYVQDLRAMSEEDLAHAPEGTRSALDVTHEVALVNHRLAKRLRSEDPGPWPGTNGFLRAPENERTGDAAVRSLQDSVDALVAAFGDDPMRTVNLPSGPVPVLDLALDALAHMAYHDGQLNYIQSLRGDTAVHWS